MIKIICKKCKTAYYIRELIKKYQNEEFVCDCGHTLSPKYERWQ